MTTDDLPPYLSRRQAANYLTAQGLPITASALTKLAHTGDGPQYKIFGRRAVYHRPDLMTWARSHMAEPCTLAHQAAMQAPEVDHA